MKKIYSFLLLVTLIAQAQQPPVHYPTPAPVWEFTKYGNTPVSEYKGLVNLSLPLYNIQVDNVSLPLNMDYYTGGIRVTEEASSVGLGWSINSSIPMVIQQVKDKNDYATNTSFQKLPPYQGNPALPSEGICPTPGFPYWTFDPNATYSLPGIQDIPYLKYVTNNKVIDWDGHYNINFPSDSKYNEMFEPSTLIIDTEPDIFTVSINGEQIKFCRQQVQEQNVTSSTLATWSVVVLKGSGYYVQLLPNTLPYQQNGYNTTIGGMKITCPNGSQYFFNLIEKANSGGGDYTSINYKLTKIVTCSTREILFNYAPVVGVTEMDKIDARYVRRNGISQMQDSPSYIGSGTNYTSANGMIPTYCGSFNYNSTDKYCPVPMHVFYDYYFLQSITTPTEQINFTYSSRLDNTTMKKLDNFEVKNMFNLKVKKFIFNYDYFVSNDNATKRLKLLSVTEEGSNPYLFDYNTTQLPKKDSFSIDYWGFYNGHPNTSFKPDLTDLGYPQYTDNISNNFNANINYTKACSLERVTYPTKGYTVFEYETHEFDNLMYYAGSSTPIINHGGGLRIKNVTDYDFGDEIVSRKRYEYFGGKCINKRVLKKESTELVGYPNDNPPYEILTVSTPVIISTINNFLNQTENSMGDYIGYDKVIITQEGTTNVGKTERFFSNKENLCINPYNIYYTNALNYSNRNDIENGNVIEENIYNSSNEILLKKTSSYINKNYDFELYGMSKQISGVKAFYVFTMNGGPSNNTFYPITLATFYPIYEKKSFLLNEVTTQYYNGNSKTITKDYNINDSGRIVDEISQENGAMYQNRNISTQHTTWTYDLPLLTSKRENNIVTEVQKFTYESILNYIRLKKVEIFPNGDLSLTNKKMNYDLYDDKNNILQYHQENGINTCIIWGYNKTLPVAKIENITYSQITSYVANIQSLSNINNEVNLLSALNAFRVAIQNQYPNVRVTTFTHKPLVGVSTITDSNGNKMTYSYDNFGKLINVKDNENNILSENEYHFKP